jgi:ATP phosphoribosyltransferase
VTAEVLADHDVGGELTPEIGDLDVLLLEHALAGLAADARGANRLRIIDIVMESNTQLIANRIALADPWKQNKLENIALLLKAAIEAHGRVGLMLNVRRSDLGSVLALLPALQRPTISALSDDEWVAVNTIIEERTVRDLIPKLKTVRAQGIVEYPLNKIVL